MLKQKPSCILAVDDEAEIRKFLQLGLKKEGFEVDTAQDAQEAWEKLKRASYDAMLLDIRMPGKTGMELLPEVRANFPYTPVIMLTAVGDTKTAVECMKLGALDFLPKPCALAEVVASLERATEYGKLLKERAELMRLQEDLTHMIIHDMRNELTPIVAVLDLVTQTAKLDEKEKRFMQSALTASNNLTNMIQSLLEVSKLEKGELPLNRQRLDARSVTKEAAQSFSAQAEKKGVELSTNCDDGVQVDADQDLLRRILYNLIHNAFKFTPKGGKVTLSASKGDEGVTFCVQDTGPGVPKAYHEKVFEKFASAELRQQGERRGTGLGLTFCKLAVEAHGGKIWLESEEGRGAKFFFTIPERK